MLEKLVDVIAERAALIVMRRLLKEGGADVLLSAVGPQAAYRFLKKNGFAVADSELFRQELDRRFLVGAQAYFEHRNDMGPDAR